MHDLFTTLSCLTACWQEDESDFLPGVYVCGNNGVIDEYLNSSHRRSILFLRQRSGRLTGFSCSAVGWRKTGRILRLSFVQRTILEENLKTLTSSPRLKPGDSSYCFAVGEVLVSKRLPRIRVQRFRWSYVPVRPGCRPRPTGFPT